MGRPAELFGVGIREIAHQEEEEDEAEERNKDAGEPASGYEDHGGDEVSGEVIRKERGAAGRGG